MYAVTMVKGCWLRNRDFPFLSSFIISVHTYFRAAVSYTFLIYGKSGSVLPIGAAYILNGFRHIWKLTKWAVFFGRGSILAGDGSQRRLKIGAPSVYRSLYAT